MTSTAKTTEIPPDQISQNQESESGEAGNPEPYGKWIKCVYEGTFIVVVVTLGTLAGAIMGALMPIAFPFVILWQRYVLPRKTLERIRKTKATDKT